MIKFKELLCEKLHGGHLLRKEDIVQLGAMNKLDPFNYEYSIICSRCNKMSIVDRKWLDENIKEKI